MSATVESAEPRPGFDLGDWLGSFRQRIVQGEVGSLSVIAGIIVIWAVFWYLNPNFLTPRNLTNLVLQLAGVGTISVGIVLVLLLGEIDLSVGAVSGLCAAVMAVVNVKLGVPAVPAIAGGVVAGTVIGLVQGTWVARLRVPSFVVTLAGLLAWQGALLLVLGQTGTINLYNPTIDGLTGTFFPSRAGWALAVAMIVVYAALGLLRRRRRARAGLSLAPVTEFAGFVAVIAALTLAAVFVLNSDRGVPLVLLILLGFIFLFDQVLRRTRFGRYVFAVGGNAEAARRAGINVNAVRIAVFALCSTLAACGGILLASRLLAVNQSSGANDLLLNSIAGPVIGGTSLFGGRGSVWTALTGALVISSINNGMDLLALSSAIKFLVIGGVLLAAVTIDALARRVRETAGRA
jgi:D-xylose transport system permease protein